MNSNDGLAAFNRWLERYNRQRRNGVSNKKRFITVKNEDALEIREDRMSLIKRIKEKHPNKHPLDNAETFYRYQRLYRTYKTRQTLTNHEKMEKQQIPNTKIKKALAEAGVTFLDVAKHFDITDAAVYQWFMEGRKIPNSRYEEVIKLAKLTPKNGVHKEKEQAPTGRPTVAEVARMKGVEDDKEEEREEEEKQKKPPFVMPTPHKLMEMEKPSIHTLDSIRKELHIPMIAFSKAIGESKDAWSRWVRNKHNLTPSQRGRAKRKLWKFMMVMEGVEMAPHTEHVVKEIKQTKVQVLEDALLILFELPMTESRERATSYINHILAVYKEISKEM